jgi:hypothetical protein
MKQSKVEEEVEGSRRNRRLNACMEKKAMPVLQMLECTSPYL